MRRFTFRYAAKTAIREGRREWRRQRREQQRQQRLYEKELRYRRAVDEVEQYEKSLESFLLVHRIPCERIDWNARTSSSPPVEPSRSSRAEDEAAKVLAAFRPTFLDKLFGRVDSKREALKRQVLDARRRDDEDYEAARKRFPDAYRGWESDRELAEHVMSGDTRACSEALHLFDPFRSDDSLRSKLRVEVHENLVVEATIRGLGQSSVPSQKKKVLKSGSTTVKPMNRTEFFQLYQGYVCGTALRVAKGIFWTVPVNGVVVTVTASFESSSGGAWEEKPILSVAFPRTTLQDRDLDSVDPVLLVRELPHRMRFLKTRGYTPVPGLDPLEFGKVE